MRIKHAFAPFYEKVILEVFGVDNMFFVVRPTNQMDPNGNSTKFSMSKSMLEKIYLKSGLIFEP